MRSRYGLCEKFSSACCMLGRSMSIAVMRASGLNCAISMATTPQPVPMSRILPFLLRGARAESKTASVPTFIVERLWFNAKCLNWNSICIKIKKSCPMRDNSE